MREFSINRKTKETDINLALNLDGGDISINTNIGFLNHMLELLAYHSNIGLTINASGDTDVDFHHLVEDIGICFGKAISSALNKNEGIVRYGSFRLPMDDSLVSVDLDLSGRPFLVFNCDFAHNKVGNFDLELVEEFFRAVSSYGGITLHINLLYGKNKHHIAEAMFKGFARAFKIAIVKTGGSVASTKGVLE